MNELILIPIGTSGAQGKCVKQSTLGLRGQRSGSYEAKNRLGGMSGHHFPPRWVEWLF